MGNKSTFNYRFVSNVDAIKNASQTAIDNALEKIGGKAETYAKKLCPVRTGNLKNSITHKKSTEEQNTMLVGSNVEYAPYVELGHDQEVGRYVPAIKKRLVASHVNGKPFIRPAVENNVNEYIAIIQEALKTAPDSNTGSTQG